MRGATTSIYGDGALLNSIDPVCASAATPAQRAASALILDCFFSRSVSEPLPDKGNSIMSGIEIDADQNQRTAAAIAVVAEIH